MHIWIASLMSWVAAEPEDSLHLELEKMDSQRYPMLETYFQGAGLHRVESTTSHRITYPSEVSSAQGLRLGQMSSLRCRTDLNTSCNWAWPSSIDQVVLSFPQTRERGRSRFHVTANVSGGWDGDALKLGWCNIGKSQDQFLTLIQYVCRQLHLQLGDGKFTRAK